MTSIRHIVRGQSVVPVCEILEGRVCLSASITIDQTYGFTAAEHGTVGFANQAGGPYLAPFHVQGMPYDPSQFVVTLDWHDGTITKGGVDVFKEFDYSDPILYGTFGDFKTFGDPGTGQYTIKISQVGHPEVFATGDNSYLVDDLMLRAYGKAAYANSGTNQLRNVTVATFDDGEPQNGFTDPTATPANFAATINWGDGTVTAGAIVATALKGRYNVVGSHTFNSIKGQSYWTTVHVVDLNGGSDATTHGVATIYSAPVVKPITVTTAPAGGLFSTAQVGNVWDA
jgi:hypothetical protein